MAPRLSNFLSNLKSGNAFQLKFKDRIGAGKALGIALKLSVKKKKEDKFPILVLGIPRGGVIVADIVARKLNAQFDLVIARKLLAPDNKENAIGAILYNGCTYLDEFMVNSLRINSEYIEEQKHIQLKQIEQRIQLFRPSSRDYKIADRTVILIDDGIATGSTIVAAARWIRKQNPSQLVIAAPVAQPQAADLLKNEADRVEILSTPSNFVAVNQFYQDFDQATDDKVVEILKARNLL